MNIKWNMLLWVGLFFWTNTVLGEGSKDLYHQNIKGNRAFLVSKPYGNGAFSNQASHYAYVQEGETIAVASSAQNIGLGRIILTAPDGKVYQTKSNNIGQIAAFNGSTRAAELAGPGIGYVPYEVRVAEGQSGIWRIEFTSPDTDPINASLVKPYNVNADKDWRQHTEGCLIAAWDISIRNVENTDWLAGRVFMSMLQLNLSQENIANANGAFYGRNYVLTKDGYVYHIDGNGSHGIDFAYFVNSSGILDEEGKPSYRSANDQNKAKYHSPNAIDDNSHITHKMFYNFPDRKMPRESTGCFPGGGSWLFNSKQEVEVKDIGLRAEKGEHNVSSKEAVLLGFETNYAGRYKVLITGKSGQHNFREREISVDAKEGDNCFIWDGLDGVGNALPAGKGYKIGISVSLVEGEIHFPYFDMEINPNGILVDRMNLDGTKYGDAIMYWDDSEVVDGQPGESSKPKVNTQGTPSRLDGHRWGSYSSTKDSETGSTNGGYGANSYGNDRAMDTWTYTTQLQAEAEVFISFEVPDDKRDEVVVEIKHLEFYQGGDFVVDLFDGLDASLRDFVKVEMLEFPTHGDFVINEKTGVYKLIDLAFIGDDVFTYQLLNEDGVVGAVCTVNLKILKTNPFAKDDFFDVVYSKIDVSEITTNDFVEHTYLNKESIRIIERPLHGTLMKDADGKWIYQSYEGYMGRDYFSYQIMDENGNWSNIATVSIFIKGLFIPNTITPNNDLKNDTFQILGLSNFDKAEVSIVDRFGRLVFASMDYKNDWVTPSNLASGVYFYVFKGNKTGQSAVISKGSLMVLVSNDFRN